MTDAFLEQYNASCEHRITVTLQQVTVTQNIVFAIATFFLYGKLCQAINLE